MTVRTPARQAKRQPPPKDRRAAADARGPVRLLRRLTGLLKRPIGLQRREGKWRLVFIDRRRSRAESDAQALGRLHAELRASLLHYAPEHAAQLMRQLVQVHDELVRKGWAGVTALPAPVRSKALFQAELLAREEATPALLTVIARLRALQAPADAEPAAAAEAPARADRVEDGAPVEISEVSHEEFHASQHSWLGNLPPLPDATERPHTAR